MTKPAKNATAKVAVKGLKSHSSVAVWVGHKQVFVSGAELSAVKKIAPDARARDWIKTKVNTPAKARAFLSKTGVVEAHTAQKR